MPPPITGTGHNFVFADELFYTTVQTGANETTVVNSFVDGLVPHNPTPPHNQYYDGVFIDPSLQALHDELKMKNKAALTKKKVIDENTTVAVYFGLPYVGNSTDKFICGIEYEVEAVSYYEVNKSTELFRYTHDVPSVIIMCVDSFNCLFVERIISFKDSKKASLSKFDSSECTS